MVQQLVTLSNGETVGTGVFAAFLELQKACKAATGHTLTINSGWRGPGVQEAIFRSRYVLWPQVAGRRVYDTRKWLGQTWYRVSPDGTVAIPGTSRHERAGAVDFGGIPANGNNALARWLRANASRFGFSPTGYGFGEAWHYDFTGNPWAGSGVTPWTPPPVTPPKEDTLSAAEVAAIAAHIDKRRGEDRAFDIALAAGRPGVAGCKLDRYAKSDATGNVFALYSNPEGIRFRRQVTNAAEVKLLDAAALPQKDIWAYDNIVNYDGVDVRPGKLEGYGKSSGSANTWALYLDSAGNRVRRLVVDPAEVAGLDVPVVEQTTVWSYAPTNTIY